MGFTGILTGTVLGLTTKLGSNMLQKVPMMRHPWEHLLFMGAGAATGSFLQNKYHRDLEDIEDLRLYLERRENMRKDN